jgi:hypothetical protein
LQGQLLEVIGWTHRHGSLHLILVLPDGSRSLIPAIWTDLNEGNPKNLPSANSQPTSDAIATTNHLIHARKIVDALLCKLHSSEEEFKKASKEESKRAKTNGPLARITGTVSDSGNLGTSQSPTKKRYHNRSGQPDQQNGLCRRHKPDSGGKP